MNDLSDAQRAFLAERLFRFRVLQGSCALAGASMAFALGFVVVAGSRPDPNTIDGGPYLPPTPNWVTQLDALSLVPAEYSAASALAAAAGLLVYLLSDS